VYRIGDVDEMYELGYEEYFYGKGVSIVEWADLIEDIMPEDTLTINIEYGEKEGERIYKCTF
jgi:tRNA threonylcarbamoyladenosine biosynthesis protein TsaE